MLNTQNSHLVDHPLISSYHTKGDEGKPNRVFKSIENIIYILKKKRRKTKIKQRNAAGK